MSSKTNVNVLQQPNSGPYYITVDDMYLRPSKGAVILEWDLATGGWEFPSNGITIDSDPNAVFTSLGASGEGSKKFKINDKNSDTSTYKYTVRVQPTANPAGLISLDPYIVNSGVSP